MHSLRFLLCLMCFAKADNSDVVETVTSETETWLKFRDETDTETLS